MGQAVPSLKPDETHIHCAVYVCVCLFHFFKLFGEKKIFVCDCMGPEDSETPCLPQTSDCPKVTPVDRNN